MRCFKTIMVLTRRVLMKRKISWSELPWYFKVGVIGGFCYLVEFTIYFIYGVYVGFTGG